MYMGRPYKKINSIIIHLFMGFVLYDVSLATLILFKID